MQLTNQQYLEKLQKNLSDYERLEKEQKNIWLGTRCEYARKDAMYWRDQAYHCYDKILEVKKEMEVSA